MQKINKINDLKNFVSNKNPMIKRTKAMRYLDNYFKLAPNKHYSLPRIKKSNNLKQAESGASMDDIQKFLEKQAMNLEKESGKTFFLKGQNDKE